MAKKLRRSKDRTNVSIVVPSIIAITLLLVLTVYKTQFLSFMPSFANTDSSAAATLTPVESRYRSDIRHNANAGTDISTQPKLFWQFPPTGSAYCKYKTGYNYAPPVVTKSTVYYMCGGTGDASTNGGQGLYALDIDTGAVKWRLDFMKTDVCPAPNVMDSFRMELVDGVIYTNNCKKTVAINATNGSIKWRTPLLANYNLLGTAPLVGIGRVYITAAGPAGPNNAVQSYMAALNITNGAVIWFKTFPGISDQELAGTLDASKLIVAGDKMAQYIDDSTGTPVIKWQKSYTDFLFSPSNLKNHALHFGGYNGKVYSVDRSTGAPVWTFQADGPISAHLAAGTDSTTNTAMVTFATTLGSIYSIKDTTTKPNGEQIWKASYGATDPGHFSPSVFMTRKSVYVGNAIGEIKAFKLSNGALLWTLPSSPSTQKNVNEVTIVNGRIYAVDQSQLLRVFK